MSQKMWCEIGEEHKILTKLEILFKCLFLEFESELLQEVRISLLASIETCTHISLIHFINNSDVGMQDFIWRLVEL
jgi:hypothetical protein